MSDDTNGKKIEYLKVDNELSGQKFVCLSFITPELIKNCNVRAVKVRGIFSTQEEAKDRCIELNKIDPDFNIYVAPVGHWLPWCDDPDKAEDCEYSNKELNKLMKAYKENQVRAKMLHEERKNDLIEKNLREVEERKRKLEKEKEKKEEKNNDNDDNDDNDNEVNDNKENNDNDNENEVNDNEENNDNEVNNNEVNKENKDNKNKVELKENVSLEEINRIEKIINESKIIIDKNNDKLSEKEKILKEKEELKEHINDELERAKELYDKLVTNDKK